MRDAVEQARKGGCGPQMVVAHLLRLCGHGEHDDAQYIFPPKPNKLLSGRDCLKVAEDHLLRRAWADAAVIQRLREEATLEVEQAVATVQREPSPDPYAGKLVRAVVAPFERTI